MEELQIKNMVCPRCVMAVENMLFDRHVDFEKVVLGKAVLLKKPNRKLMAELESDLIGMGFEILLDKDIQRIEKIKSSLHQVLQLGEISPAWNLSEYIKSNLNEDYSKLSHLFSSTEGVTIEKFFIGLKIDKVKEWLFYEEMDLSQISYKLDYSSVQHLSSQFKKVTGMTPSDYKKIIKKSPLGWK